MQSESFQHKKSLGQHFLNSDIVPEWLCDAGDVNKNDTVLEIGPGTGALTKALLRRGAKVIALETDPRAIEILEKTFHTEITSGQLQLVLGDVRIFDLRSLGLVSHQFKTIANIPYYLSGLLFRQCLDSALQPNQLVFLVQKEVAKRATTELKRNEKESLLSLSIKVFGDPAYVKTVTKGHFTPPPKVDSAILAVRNISTKRLQSIPVDRFFQILHAGFGQKRKQLVGNLTEIFSREYTVAALEKTGLRTDIRAEDISVENWITLITYLEKPSP